MPQLEKPEDVAGVCVSIRTQSVSCTGASAPVPGPQNVHPLSVPETELARLSPSHLPYWRSGSQASSGLLLL